LKLGLGTAQFGQSYGIANKGELVSRETLVNILDFAKAYDVDLLDTASDYGNCESQLGAYGVSGIKVVTKLPGTPDDKESLSTWVHSKVQASLNTLQIDRLHGLLMHRPMELLDHHGDKLYRAILAQKDAGIVDKIGVSVYSPDELALITNRYTVDIVQLPCNVMDRRFLETGWFDRLDEKGVEIHIRSVFLQGLLLLKVLPPYFSRWQHLFESWWQWLEHNGCSPVTGCISFLKSITQVDRVLVGAVSLAQIEQIVQGFAESRPLIFPDIATQDEALVNPSRWVVS